MNTERAILKGRLSDLKIRKMELETRAAANIAAAKSFLAGASVRPLAEIDVEAALVNLQEAAAQKTELDRAVADIAKVERELE